MAKAKRSIDHDLGTKVAFKTSMSLAYTIVGANKRNRPSCQSKILEHQLGAHMVAATPENM